MSKKFTGITSAGSAIPVYDKDAHSALEQKLDTSAFSSVSGEFATVDDVVAAVSGKADTSAIPSLDGYATQEWVGEQGYLTEVPESAVSGFATHEEVDEATSGKADTSGVVDYKNKPSANAISADDHTLYIKNEYGAGGEVLANNSGFYVHATNSNYGFIAGATPYSVHTNAPFTVLHYGGIFSLTNPGATANGSVVEAGWTVYGLTTKDTKQNTSAGVTTTSGVYQINENKTHYLSAKQDISGMSAYQPVGDYQPSGDYLSASESANFYPMTGNPSGFLTEHQSLDGLMQTSGLEYDGDKISGYMGSAFKAGDELPQSVTDAADYVSATSGDINATIDNVSSNSGAWGGNALPISARDGLDLEMSGDMLWIGASALNETLSGKQDTLTFEYNASDAISAINGSALAGGGGGGDVPEGVMSESGLGFNAVNEISGYNGSAIAQYGAEKQWLVHDDTLVHAANSAQYALGVNLSAVAQLLGVDETVLFEGNIPMTPGSTARCTESIYNFKKIKFLYNASADNEYQQNSNYTVETDQTSATNRISWQDGFTIGNNWYNRYYNRFTVTNGTDLTLTNANCYWGNTADAGYSVSGHDGHFYKIIGIGRKQ